VFHKEDAGTTEDTSGHHGPLDEPDLVVAAIRDVIATARG
jgi:hypothetical protein